MRKISLILMSLLIVMCFTVPTFAAETTFDLSANGDNSVYATFNDETGLLVISGLGDMKDFTSSSATPLKSILSSVKKLVVEDGITDLGDYLFYNSSSYCLKNCTEVSLPTSLKSIGKYTFAYMGVTEISLPDDLQMIDEYSFYYTNIKSVVIPASVEEIGKFALSTSSLVGITFEENSNLKVIGESAFVHASFSSIDIPDSVETIGKSAFSHISELTSVVIPDSVTSMGDHAFYYCSGLKSVKISNNLTTIQGYSFEGCSSLKTVIIGDSVKTIGEYAFARTGLESIVLPASVDTIKNWAFSYSYSLTSLTMLCPDSQTVASRALASVGDKPTIYQYRANTTLTSTVLSEYPKTATIIYLDDDVVLSGSLDTGVSWEYTPNTKTLTFVGSGSIPNFKVGSQPWYGSVVQNGGVDTYKFSDEITSVGSGTIGSYGNSSYGAYGSGSLVYGPAGLNYSNATYMGTVSSDSSGSIEGGAGSAGDGSGDLITLPKDEDVMIILLANPTNFMVTVPIAINAFMDGTGNISTGDGYYIENACAWGPVVIKDVKVVTESEWTLVDFDSDFVNMKASTKCMGMKINGTKVAITGVVSMNDSLSSSIKYQDSKELTFEVKLPAQKVDLQENIAAVVFTVDFDKV